MNAEGSAPAHNAAVPLGVLIVGAGFAGIGQAIALQRAGITDFLILEKSPAVGGVWRDNTYPGAACDIPSQLYSFSFEPNPRWSRVYSPQAEIHQYLRDCADKHQLHRRTRFGAEVARAEYDETASSWTVTLVGGEVLRTRLLVSATGQLGRPVVPRIDGLESFAGPHFHSARWNHDVVLAGKRVAVIGTGASAAQFVPAIAPAVAELKVFQRSPAWMIPRADRAYTAAEQSRFARHPWLLRLVRTRMYWRHEVQAFAFTRFKGLMKIAGEMPFRRMLNRQVADPALRRRLTPDYQVGCKRVLLTSEYLATMARPNVRLVTDEITRVTARGIETADGCHHAVDAIVWGTGFAASEFLAPMRVIGRGGVALDDQWRDGAQAWLGLSVPNFPNFFMLYGPNTNLGHNSIIQMLESQIAHVVRCVDEMRRTRADAIEVDAVPTRRFNAQLQRRLATSVWNGCRSWYVDAAGRSSVNWPGFTVTYRWLTGRKALTDYRLSRRLPGTADRQVIAAPTSRREAAVAAGLRGLLRVVYKAPIGPPLGAFAQRCLVTLLEPTLPGVRGVARSRGTAGGVRIETVAPAGAASAAAATTGAILYLHGGGFCVARPRTHRAITTRLARDAGVPVWVPDYRLAPEHPYPAALDDALATFAAMRRTGLPADRIVVAGDSAGGALALALAIRLRDRGEALPGGLMLLSPVTDTTLSGATMTSAGRRDPMLRRSWLEQAMRWYACPSDAADHQPLVTDLAGLPPMLIQVGDEELLQSDAERLADHAARCGVPCRIERYEARWHVFQLQAFHLASARAAIARLAEFARGRIALGVEDGFETDDDADAEAYDDADAEPGMVVALAASASAGAGAGSPA